MGQGLGPYLDDRAVRNHAGPACRGLSVPDLTRSPSRPRGDHLVAAAALVIHSGGFTLTSAPVAVTSVIHCSTETWTERYVDAKHRILYAVMTVYPTEFLRGRWDYGYGLSETTPNPSACTVSTHFLCVVLYVIPTTDRVGRSTRAKFQRGPSTFSLSGPLRSRISPLVFTRTRTVRFPPVQSPSIPVDQPVHT
jgi:hypothetical protein